MAEIVRKYTIHYTGIQEVECTVVVRASSVTDAFEKGDKEKKTWKSSGAPIEEDDAGIVSSDPHDPELDEPEVAHFESCSSFPPEEEEV